MSTFLKVLENEAQQARPSARRKAEFEQSCIEVRMFNVGLGEAILLVFPHKRAWLVDGGSSNSPSKNRKLGEGLVDFLDERGLTLEAFVASHPHVDHVGAVATILASGSPRVASSVAIYRSDDATWNLDKAWLKELQAAITAHGTVETLALRNAHREVTISGGLRAHLFAGSGEGAYSSIFLQLRAREARLLFTGDSHCSYEKELLDRFGAEDFRADVLKVTHHGSSSGTARSVVEAVRPGIAVASTGDDPGHRLELDTLRRLGGRPGPRAVHETLVDGDIVLRTDGGEYQGGVLYDVAFETPGRFAVELGAEIRAFEDVERTEGNDPHCQ